MLSNSLKTDLTLLVLIGILLLSPSIADVVGLTSAKESFAFIAKISSGTQSVRQFEIPYQVLQGMRRPDYGDMRILNSQNQSVPFSVAVIKPQSQQHNTKHELEFFTLPKNPHQSDHMQIEFDKYYHRFSLNSTTTASNKRSYIIIKNPYPDKALNELKLLWTKTGIALSINIKLEQSNDLEHWRSVIYSATLYDLQHADTELVKNTVILPKPVTAKYLRLSLLDKNNFVHSVTKIYANFHHQSQAELENRTSFTLHQGNTAQEWLFDTQSVAPINKIAFEIPQTGLFYQGTLYSKRNPPIVKPTRSKKSQFKKEVKKVLLYPHNRHTEQEDFPWNFQRNFSQYRLITASGEITSQAIQLSGIDKNNQWRIILNQPLTLLPDQIPKVNVAWYPVVVTFLAQGNGPFRLIFGNPDIKPLPSSLMTSLTARQIETVKLGTVNAQVQTISAAKKITLISWFKQMNWQNLLLWIVLCSFVILMATMAYKLYIAMNKQ